MTGKSWALKTCASINFCSHIYAGVNDKGKEGEAEGGLEEYILKVDQHLFIHTHIYKVAADAPDHLFDDILI